MDRKYLPSIADLIDRLAIDQIKEVLIPEHKKEYAQEIKNITQDIDNILENKKLSADLVRAVIILAQINLHIWYNESAARDGGDQDLKKLALTHGLNGIRSRVKNKILDILEEELGKDYKTDCLASEFDDWEISM